VEHERLTSARIREPPAREPGDGALEHRHVAGPEADAVELVGAGGGELPREVVLVGGEDVDREAWRLLERGQ
jgi:hypothetical protein